RSLIADGASPNTLGPHGFLALGIVAERGWTEGARALLEHGAATNQRDGNSWTALANALHSSSGSTSEKEQLVRLLLDAGAELINVDGDGTHGIFYGWWWWLQDSLCKLLVDRTDLRCISPSGQTLLMVATDRADLKHLTYFIDRGLPPDARDNE